MGNSLICCRLSWTSFTNSTDLIPDTASQSRFDFTNHGAIFPSMITSVQPPIISYESYRVIPCQQNVTKSVLDASVQHISEREPEDFAFNPSLNASNTTLFLNHVLHSITQNSSLQKVLLLTNKEKVKRPQKMLRHWSSCGSVYIGDGCLSKPDSKLILHCISVAVCSLIKSEKMRSQKSLKKNKISDSDPLIQSCADQSPSLSSTYGMESECSIGSELYHEVYEIYDERLHPLFLMPSHCEAGSYFSPDESLCIYLRFQHQILSFLNRLFTSSLLTAEGAIVALVYLERLISNLEMYIVAWSWRRQLLSCILIASKVLEDQAVWNADYCQLLTDVHVADLNDLERHTLSLLQFNTGVPPAVYARYYFDLLSLGEAVALPVSGKVERRLMTPRLARRLRVLPMNVESRTEYLSAAASCTAGTGGGGIIFDLPFSSIDDASSDTSQQDCQRGRCSSHQHRCRHRRPRSDSPPLASKHTSAVTKPKTHQHLSQTTGESECDRLASIFTSTSSSSSSSTCKSSISTASSAASACYRLPVAVSNTAFDPWSTPTGTCHFGASGGVGGGDCRPGVDAAANNVLFLLQQDAGLY